MRSLPRATPARRRFHPAALATLVSVLFGVGAPVSSASASNAPPKLIVVIVIDQFRGDYLERYHDKFGEGGFRLLLEHGANFTECNYDYANTRTAPGHATLFTGAYSDGHGIAANEWWDPKRKRMVTSVEDDDTKLVGITTDAPGGGSKLGASPHNLLADTLGDELKLATHGQARVFSISLKDRAPVLPGGFAADAAYWIDPKSGSWITSSYYRPSLPKWAQDFNAANRAAKYWIAIGKTPRATDCAQPHIPREKMAPTLVFTKWSAPRLSLTSTNWNSPKSWSSTKASVQARPPTCSPSVFLRTTFLATRLVPTPRKWPPWPSRSIANSQTSSTSWAIKSALRTSGSHFQPTTEFRPCPMPRRSSAFPPPISTLANSKPRSTPS